MKVVALQDAKQELGSYIARAQRERILITRRGKPAALVIGVEGEELEDLLTMADPQFWELIEARRRQKTTISLNEVRKRLGLARTPKSRKEKGASKRIGA